MLSIIVPCYNEGAALPFFYDEVLKYVPSVDDGKYEIILVNDGSRDNTLEVCKQLAATDNNIKYISFSRNFGKESAIYAGLEHSRGDYVVVMDADLQDPPSLLPEMFSYISNEGYDCVATRRVTRKGEPPIRSFFARCFYRLINAISQTEFVDGARDFRLMTRQFVNAILELDEYNRFSKGIFSWVGFKTKWLEYENIERVAGETKWSFFSLFTYAIDGIAAFTTKPLMMSSVLGIGLSATSFLALLFVIIRKLLFDDPTAGWTSLVCVMLFVAGLQMVFLGIIGSYLAKMYMEVKKRPIYILRESNLSDSRTEDKK